MRCFWQPLKYPRELFPCFTCHVSSIDQLHRRWVLVSVPTTRQASAPCGPPDHLLRNLGWPSRTHTAGGTPPPPLAGRPGPTLQAVLLPHPWLVGQDPHCRRYSSPTPGWSARLCAAVPAPRSSRRSPLGPSCARRTSKAIASPAGACRGSGAPSPLLAEPAWTQLHLERSAWEVSLLE
jgi:hypothetical protein